MSLIHDALKSMDAPQESKPVMAHAPVSQAGPRPAWLEAVLAFAAVLGVGMLGWYLWQNQMWPKADLTPAAVSANATAPQAVALPVPGEVAPSAVAVAPTDPATTVPSQPVDTLSAQPAQPLPAAGATESTVVADAGSPVQAVPAQAIPRKTPVRRVRTSKPVAPVEAPPPVDDTPVELRFARFVTAMKDARTDDAERELEALRARLPEGALGLVRAQAWFDLRAGRDAAAADGYRTILDRMPGDEEAAINLASIQSRQQKTEEARATLDAAARLNPDSAALRAALAQFTPTARQ
jgi:hypothetical protein